MEKIPISILVILISQLSSIGFGIFPRNTIKNNMTIQTHFKL